MDSSVIVSIITGIATIITVLVNLKESNKDISHKLETHQAVTDTKIEALTSEVREHNNFARRMPVVEEQIKDVVRRVEVVERETQRAHS